MVEFGDSRLPERFWSKCEEVTSGCWEWRAGNNGIGYGRFYANGRGVYAHRHAYGTLIAPVSRLLTCDHLCRNTLCCNPSHIEVVTQRENLLRGVGPSARHAKKTHCPRGHLLSDENLIAKVNKSGRTSRECRTCHNVSQKRRYWERKRGNQ